MTNLNEIIRKVLPKQKEITVRVVVDVAESYKQLFQAMEGLQDKDIDRIAKVFERTFKMIDRKM
jgi:biopolymer transport protein ExbD|tara:strand:+ start:43 stop:234 length:192 start_codon:yes stop_codon:yes gene_type:complete